MPQPILVTGASSGLGATLRQYFNGIAYNRKEPEKFEDQEYDAIIHCAFNTGRNIPQSGFQQYIDDNIGLTKRLLNLNHQRFVFISTVDVYPKDGKPYAEADDFLADKVEGLYGQTKLICEQLVQHSAAHYLILRPSALLGPNMRKNSLLRILDGENPELTLSADSSFNYIRHEDIAEFITNAWEDGLQGAYNLAASDNITLREICEIFGKTAKFGGYTYQAGAVDVTKLQRTNPGLVRSSLATIRLFLEARERVAA